jgi:hypothetical protein
MNAFSGPYSKKNLYIVNIRAIRYARVYETRGKKEDGVHFEAVISQLIDRLFITRKFVVCMKQKEQ